MIVSRETLLQAIPVELPPIVPLTTNASSWILHLPRFCKTPNSAVFHRVFQTHPPHQHALHLYGKKVLENRYSQLFVTNERVGSTYKYSGTARPCHVCNQPEHHPEQQFLLDLCHVSNILYQKLLVQQKLSIDGNNKNVSNKNATATTTRTTTQTKTDLLNNLVPNDDNPYNCCLVNWYQSHHHIGLHADDERELNPSIPIVSLSWGGPRRFLLRPKASLNKNNLSKLWRKNTTTNNNTNNNDNNFNPYFEIELKDGDLLFMGGKCQQEFKHEIPKVRKTKDGLVGPRISWTIRSMIPPPPPQNVTTTPSSTRTPVSQETALGKRTKRYQRMRDNEPGEEQEQRSVGSALGTPTTTQRRRF